MNPLSRLALSLALIYPVFALFNLFGQPKAFLPPLYADHILLLVFCGACIVKKLSPQERLLFILMFISIFLNGSVEINSATGYLDISGRMQWILTLLSVFIIAIGSLLFLVIRTKKIPFFTLFTKMLWMTYCLLQLLIFIDLFSNEMFLFAVYIASGLLSLLAILLIKVKDVFHNGMLLLITLLVYFDLFTYFSIKYL